MSARWRKAEPYRLLFPLGALLGMAAVALWPLFVFGVARSYPGIPHARVMIEGFAACFILGFLGTALPHMLEIRRTGPGEILLWAAGLLAAALLHLAARHPAGDLVFAFTLLVFAGGLAARARRRKARPPPGLCAVALGLLCGGAGAGLQALQAWTAQPAMVFPLSKLMLCQGFPILSVMGVGATVLPAFIGYPPRTPPGSAGREALEFLAMGALLLASFVVEAAGHPRAGHLARVAVLAWFFARHLPVHRRHRNPGTMALLTRLALLALPLGYALLAGWPAAPLALLHIVFIGGFGLLITAVAARVFVAHGGFPSLFGARWPALWWVFGLLVAAMATRVSADWMPAARYTHYAYAALSWIAGMALWLFAMRRFMLARGPEPAGGEPAAD